MKKFFKEFKDFISRGNIIDMAIGVIIGGAFSAIVNSLVNDIIMPLLTLATGDGLKGMALQLNPWVEATLEGGVANPAAIYWNYGNFIMAIINFLIIAICLFLGLKIVMSIKNASKKAAEKQKKKIEKKLQKGEITAEEAAEAVVETAAVAEETPAVAAVTTEALLMEIRDLLKAQQAQSPAEEKSEENK